MFTQYSFLGGNLWKAQTKSNKQNSYYHREMVEPNKYINNKEKFDRWLIIKD